MSIVWVRVGSFLSFYYYESNISRNKPACPPYVQKITVTVTTIPTSPKGVNCIGNITISLFACHIYSWSHWHFCQSILSLLWAMINWQILKTVMWHRLYCVFTYIYSLKIEKGLCECRNLSVKYPCALLVFLCLSSRGLFIFLVRVSPFSSYFCIRDIFHSLHISPSSPQNIITPTYDTTFSSFCSSIALWIPIAPNYSLCPSSN